MSREGGKGKGGKDREGGRFWKEGWKVSRSDLEILRLIEDGDFGRSPPGT